MAEPIQPLKGIFFKDFNASYIPHILKEMYLDNVYAPYEKYIKGGVVLDVGQNIGLFTQFALNKGAKHVFGVEPAEDHQQTLKKFLEFNNYTNVTQLPYALSHVNGETELFHSLNVTAHSLHHGMDNAGTKEKVRTVTIDQLMEENKIDRINFCKMDPEGAEFAIIGSEGFSKVAERIDAMVVEFHSWPGVNYAQAVNTLKDLGFKVTKIPSDAYIVGCER